MTDKQYSKYIDPIDYPGVNMPPSSRMTSRRAKNIESKLLKQIVVVGIITVALAAAFILVVIPNALKLLSGNSGVSNQVEDTGIPPQSPIIASPVDATNSAQLKISGFNQKGNEIVILNNGIEVKRGNTNDDGSFSLELDLQPGDNSLTAYSLNAAKKESSTTRAYLVKFDNEAPKLDISEPKDGDTINGNKNKQLSIKGITDAGARVTLNDSVVFVKSDGSFIATTQLNNGDNSISMKSTDPAGNMTEQKLTIHFLP